MLRSISLLFLSLTASAGVFSQAGNGRGATPLPPGQNPNGAHVYIWAGLKSHGEGLHDYPQFLADWSKVLTQHGAVVDGGLHFPDARELSDVDVMVMYKGDAGYMTADEKAVLESYVKRG